MKKGYRKRLADDMVSRFRKEFYGTFGVYPMVNYSFHRGSLPRVTLKELEELINNMMEEHYPKFYTPAGIRMRLRRREVVLHRQVYMKLAQDIGYGPLVTAKHIGFDHVSAMYGKKHMQELLETNDLLARNIYNTIIDAYKKRFSNDGDVQQDSSGESDTE